MILPPIPKQSLFATAAEPLEKKLWCLLMAAASPLNTYPEKQARTQVAVLVNIQLWNYWPNMVDSERLPIMGLQDRNH